MIIAIEGLIGIGKSSLQALFLERYNCHCHFQNFAAHPYLENFYNNPYQYRLSKEMIFLFMDFQELLTQKNSQELIVVDYTLEKSNVFAKSNLTKEEYSTVFLPSFEFLLNALTPPDYIIYLFASIETVKSRIIKRNRPMERQIIESYLKNIEKNYKLFLSKKRNLILIDVDKDFLMSDSHGNNIFEELEKKYHI